MSLQDVRNVVRSYEGSGDDMFLDSRAGMMTVGDLRRLLALAEREMERIASESWPEGIGAAIKRTIR
jgi:hypothetical protein